MNPRFLPLATVMMALIMFELEGGRKYLGVMSGVFGLLHVATKEQVESSEKSPDPQRHILKEY